MVLVTIGGATYYINPKLKETWDKIKDGRLNELDEDRIYIVDGKERSGKSLFTLQQAAYIDPSILNDPTRITYGVEETVDKIRQTESSPTQTKVIVWDEAFRGLSSKSAISRINKQIIQLFMEMGQKNLVLFLVTPSFFLLERYAAVSRSNALFHIIKSKKSNERYFRAFNENKKAILYKLGIQKGWGYPVHTKYKDYFRGVYPGGDEFERVYRKRKLAALMTTEEDTVLSQQKERVIIKKYLKNNLKLAEPIDTKTLSILFNVPLRTIQQYLKEIKEFEGDVP